MARTKKEKIVNGEPLNLSQALAHTIKEWLAIKGWLEKGRVQEFQLREAIIKELFPVSVEGTNRRMGPGVEATFVKGFTRKLQVDTLDAIMLQFPPESDYRKLGTLIEYKPAFKMETYRTMSEADRKTFEQTLEITDASPQLEIVMAEDRPAEVENRQAANDIGTAVYGKPPLKTEPAKKVGAAKKSSSGKPAASGKKPKLKKKK